MSKRYVNFYAAAFIYFLSSDDLSPRIKTIVLNAVLNAGVIVVCLC